MHNVLFVMAGAQALAAPAAPSLYVVGCGVLGRATCRLWREAHPGARIIGETASTASHAELERLGATPATRAARGTPAKCANVLFCAPPSAYGDEEYAAEVTEAARACWDGSGAFLMASSGGVFAEDAGGVVDEAPFNCGNIFLYKNDLTSFLSRRKEILNNENQYRILRNPT